MASIFVRGGGFGKEKLFFHVFTSLTKDLLITKFRNLPCCQPWWTSAETILVYSDWHTLCFVSKRWAPGILVLHWIQWHHFYLIMWIGIFRAGPFFVQNCLDLGELHSGKDFRLVLILVSAGELLPVVSSGSWTGTLLIPPKSLPRNLSEAGLGYVLLRTIPCLHFHKVWATIPFSYVVNCAFHFVSLVLSKVLPILFFF